MIKHQFLVVPLVLLLASHPLASSAEPSTCRAEAGGVLTAVDTGHALITHLALLPIVGRKLASDAGIVAAKTKIVSTPTADA